MGRIKTALVKRVSNELINEHRDKFKDDFDDNKKIVEELADLPSKKLRNVIAGHITKLIKNKEEV